jgi:cytidylate kinase
VPKDAIIMDTTQLSQDEVVKQIVATVRSGREA